MVAQAQHLRAQRRRGDRQVLRASNPSSAPSGRSSTSPASPEFPARSARWKNSSVSSLPSRRMVFRFMSRTSRNWSRRRCSSVRSSMSCDQPAPRIRIGLPLTRNSRLPFGRELRGDLANVRTRRSARPSLRPARGSSSSAAPGAARPSAAATKAWDRGCAVAQTAPA